jgi:hypothetical protein
MNHAISWRIFASLILSIALAVAVASYDQIHLIKLPKAQGLIPGRFILLSPLFSPEYFLNYLARIL